MDEHLQFLSCDWGTSSFRLRWISGQNHEIIRQYRDEAGSRSLFERSQKGESLAHAYETQLRDVLNSWDNHAREVREPLPLVISGMASSSIGWRELPYAAAPLKLDGSNLSFAKLDWKKPEWIGTTYLLSGVATQVEIMRGEETEAIGLLSELPQKQSLTLVLPGTHSKHLSVQAGEIIDIRTFMTGELFEVLARHSILKASIDPGSSSETSPDSFEEGVLWARQRGLGAALFRTRTRAVLDHRPASENNWFLSGVLIGAELLDLLDYSAHSPIYLAGTGRVGELYVRAMTGINPEETRWFTIPQTKVERAVSVGHAIFLRKQAV
jgi:2-dehydro-3-deoxygalactonokinase